MKNLFYLLAAAAVIVLLISAGRFLQQIKSVDFISFPPIAAMGEVNPDEGYIRVVEKFRKKVEMYTSDGRRQQNNYFWCTFLVTIISAASTLISSILAARKESQFGARTAVIVALLAFLATIGNFASGHLENLKTAALKKAVDLSTLRSQFVDGYNRADAGTRDAVIRQYEAELDN